MEVDDDMQRTTHAIVQKSLGEMAPIEVHSIHHSVTAGPPARSVLHHLRIEIHTCINSTHGQHWCTPAAARMDLLQCQAVRKREEMELVTEKHVCISLHRLIRRWTSPLVGSRSRLRTAEANRA
jgi:hypothetical protein